MAVDSSYHSQPHAAASTKNVAEEEVDATPDEGSETITRNQNTSLCVALITSQRSNWTLEWVRRVHSQDD